MKTVDELMDLANRFVYDSNWPGTAEHKASRTKLRVALAGVGQWRLIVETDKVEWHSRIVGVWTSGEWLTYGMAFWNPDDPGYWWDTLNARRVRHQPTYILDAPELPALPTPPTTTQGE